MKIVAFVEIYNFVVQTFKIWNHLEAQIIDILSRSKIWILNLNIVSTVWAPKLIQIDTVWTAYL
jgi:hypothetical protein